ncbi:uncharacterized protein PAE49_012749 [Odontesthes bonariensis]
MSSVQHLREFISQRLTPAAEEIFSEFEKTIVQYKEEIGRQSRLLDISWKPQIKLHRVVADSISWTRMEQNQEQEQEPNPEPNPSTSNRAGSSSGSTGPQKHGVQEGSRWHCCKDCGKVIKRSNLRYHQRLHTGEKPYSCDQCGAAFTGLSDLKKHQRIHSGDKPFICASSTLTCNPVEPEDELALFLVEGLGSWFYCSILVLVL